MAQSTTDPTIAFTEKTAEQIRQLAKAVESLGNGQLKSEAIVTLLHDQTRMSKVTIRCLLAAIKAMPSIWLKPEKVSR